MRRVGILGGSFNPIHNGHLHLAQAALNALQLDEIRLMPAGVPPHKSDAEYAPAEDRLAMCRLAAEADARLTVSAFELSRNEKSYTVHTLRHLHQTEPEHHFYWLVGSDMLLSFRTWHKFAEILSLCTLVVLSRGTESQPMLQHAAEDLGSYGEIVLLPVDPICISSTEIRKMIKNHANYSCYLPKKVVQYIRLQHLYSDNLHER